MNMTSQKNSMLKDLSWVVLDQDCFRSAGNSDLFNRTYRHWRTVWSEILDVKQDLTSESFLRQAKICPLLYGERVIGLITCSFFNSSWDATFDHPYLKAFDKKVLSSFRAPSDIFMTIEYLSVCEEFRKSEVGVSLGDVLLGLSMQIFKQSPAAYVLGTARLQIKVNKMCHNFGFQPIGVMSKFGHSCELIINTRNTLTDQSDPSVHNLIHRLWQPGQYVPAIQNLDLVS